MLISLLKAKLHHARVTDCKINYQGSLTLDPEWMETLQILPYEEVHVYNIENGNRFSTYVIPGEKGARQVVLNGAAARLAAVGDRLIIAVYAWYEPDEAQGHQPRLLVMGEGNKILANRGDKNLTSGWIEPQEER